MTFLLLGQGDELASAWKAGNEISSLLTSQLGRLLSKNHLLGYLLCALAHNKSEPFPMFLCAVFSDSSLISLFVPEFLGQGSGLSKFST